jgi:hypothetical protein
MKTVENKGSKTNGMRLIIRRQENRCAPFVLSHQLPDLVDTPAFAAEMPAWLDRTSSKN